MSARTATVQNVCALPGSPLKPITKGPVSAKLNTISFTIDGTTEKARHRYTDVDPVTGYWSLTLELNDDLDPADTSWIIKEPTGATWTVQLVAANAGQTVNLRDVIVANPLNPNPIQAGIPRVGVSYMVGLELSDGHVEVLVSSPWGIDTGGHAYFQASGAAPGEAAVLQVESDGSLSVVKVNGSVAA